MRTLQALLSWRALALTAGVGGFALTCGLNLVEAPPGLHRVVLGLLAFLTIAFASGFRIGRTWSRQEPVVQAPDPDQTARTANEQRFRLIAEAVPQIFWLTLPDGSVVSLNGLWQEYTGLETATVEDLRQAVHPDDLADLLSRFEVAKAAGMPYQAEFRLRRASDGAYRWFLARSVPVADLLFGGLCWVGTSTDIHQQKLAEQRFQQLADAMPQIVWTARPDGHLDYYNKRWYEFTGLPEGPGVDQNWQPILHPEDLDRCLQVWNEAVRCGTAYQIEYRLKEHATGRYRWHLGRALPVKENGRVVRWFGTCTDIEAQKQAEQQMQNLNEALEDRIRARTAELETANAELRREAAERQLAQEKFRVVFEFSSDAHLLMDEREGILDCNQAAVAMLRCRDKSAVLSLHPAVLSPEFQPDGRRSLEKCVEMDATARRSGHHRFDWLHQRQDGEVFLCEVTLTPVPLGGRTVLLVVWHDLTERARAQEELRRAKEAAEVANRAKSEFLANMSHEIRTPMNGVLGMTELVLDTDLSREQRELVTTVHASAEALLTIINDILDFSRIEAGKLDLDPAPLRLRDALAETLRPLALRAQKKGLGLTCDVRPDVPDALVGDWGRLRQILVNLIGNALKFTLQGEVVLSVTHGERDCRPVCPSHLATLPRSGGSERHPELREALLRFSVRDTGIGIPAHRLGAIFDPFEQADGSTARTFGGTGLGLAISSRLVRLLGGDLRVDSEQGRGSAFSFTVCLALAEESGVTRPQARPVQRTDPTARPLRILLAEDNVVNQRVAVGLLTKQGHRVTVTATGQEALDALAGQSFDAVLMDVQMPVMDGFEATALLRQREQGTGRHTPVIALTAHAMKGDKERCLANGMDGYVSKPIQADQLRRALAALLQAAGGGEAVALRAEHVES